MIYPTVSNITWCAYGHITTQRGFVLRCNHKRLILKRVERKRIGIENHLARIHQDIRDNVAFNYACSPVNHALGDATSLSSNDSNSNGVWINTSGYNWCVTNVSICDWLFTSLNLFIPISYFIFLLIQIMICQIVDRLHIFIYLFHIKYVMFMPCFLFSFQLSD